MAKLLNRTRSYSSTSNMLHELQDLLHSKSAKWYCDSLAGTARSFHRNYSRAPSIIFGTFHKDLSHQQNKNVCVRERLASWMKPGSLLLHNFIYPMGQHIHTQHKQVRRENIIVSNVLNFENILLILSFICTEKDRRSRDIQSDPMYEFFRKPLNRVKCFRVQLDYKFLEWNC